MNEKYVSHDQLLFILLVILIGLAIFSFAMIKHAVELRQRTTTVIEDLALVQTYIDVELAAKLLEQQAAITLISDVQQFQGQNIEKLNENSNISYTIFDKIITGIPLALSDLNGYNQPLG
jgi:hypothetical protein